MGLTWSSSRDQILHSCERKYYFQYLVPARINSSDPTLREIAFLKKLKTLPLWKGSLFHEIIAEYFRKVQQRQTIQNNAFLADFQKSIESQWVYSLGKEYLRDPRKIGQGNALALMEHEYGVRLPEDTLPNVIRDVRNWFLLLLSWVDDNGLLRKFQQASNLWIEPQAYGRNAPGFDYNDVQVLTKVDLAINNNDRSFDIYDWKSSQAPSQRAWNIEQAELQVSVYQLWPHLRFNIPLNGIKAHLIYLGDNPPKHKMFEMDGNRKEYILNLVGKSISRTKQFDELHSGEQLSLTDLDFASSTSICRFCQFKRLCQRELTT